jgi:hypothetical protein
MYPGLPKRGGTRYFYPLKMVISKSVAKYIHAKCSNFKKKYHL